MHSYSKDIAGVVRMRSVSGGSNLRTSRGSRGVSVANCSWVSDERDLKTNDRTHQLDQLDGHPVVTAVHQKLKQTRSQWEEIIRAPPA